MTTEASAAPVEQVGVNPAGSPAADTAAVTGAAGTVDVKTLLDQHPELADEILRHPTLKQRFDADVQSRSDRLTARQIQAERQRWEAELAAQQAAETRKRERQQKLEMEPEELGRQEQERLRHEALVEPVSAELAQRYKREGWNEGYQAFADEMVASINDSPVWKQLSIPERQKLVDETAGGIAGLNRRLAKMEAEALAGGMVDQRLAEMKRAQERENLAGERNTRPAPDLGGGASVGGDADFLAAFAAGQNSDFARARRLLGMT